MENLFVGLHYDYGPHNKLDIIEKLGTYILTRFPEILFDVPEYRVYSMAVSLCYTKAIYNIQKQPPTSDYQYLSVIVLLQKIVIL